MRGYWIQFVRHYLVAVQFFTRIPVTGRVGGWVGYSPALLSASAAHFPGVGWLVGGLTSGVLWGMVHLLPALPAAVWVAAVVSTVFGMLLTGAFHEDGLADTADGLGGGFSRERALDIMKDSRIGTYGAAALILALMSKLALLVMLVEYSVVYAAWGLFTGHVTSRLMPLFVIRMLPYVGDTGQSKAKPLAKHIGNFGVLAGIIWWALAMLACEFFVPAFAWGFASCGAVLGALIVYWRLQRRLQGFTGDGLGAVQQVAEIGFYLGIALSLGRSFL